MYYKYCIIIIIVAADILTGSPKSKGDLLTDIYSGR